MLEAKKSPLFEALFGAYTVHALRRAFHAVHLTGREHLEERDPHASLLLLGNHSSWWDALLPLFLSRNVFGLDSYAMMEEKQLERFPFFRRIGVFSIKRENPKDVSRSLHYARSILARPGTALWMYPQGALLAPHTRPLRFQRGAARLVGSADRVLLTPFALHYAFRHEQQPEVFISIGAGISAADHADGETLVQLAEARVTALLDAMLADMVGGDLRAYETVLRGRRRSARSTDAAPLPEGGR